MVAYSFKERFAQPILAGTKRQTIRADRGRHARPGEPLQLYTGMRTKKCRLIARTTCEAVTPVRLSFSRTHGPLIFAVDGAELGADEMQAFAERDGFADVFDMTHFWLDTHGKGADDVVEFTGVLVGWLPIRRAA